MNKRKVNIRKACDEINGLIEHAINGIRSDTRTYTILALEMIKKRTRRIKRTTWRGKEGKCCCNNREKLDVINQVPYY